MALGQGKNTTFEDLAAFVQFWYLLWFCSIHVTRELWVSPKPQSYAEDLRRVYGYPRLAPSTPGKGTWDHMSSACRQALEHIDNSLAGYNWTIVTVIQCKSKIRKISWNLHKVEFCTKSLRIKRQTHPKDSRSADSEVNKASHNTLEHSSPSPRVLCSLQGPNF